MTSHQIAVSVDTALSHASKLTNANDAVPDGSWVSGSLSGANSQSAEVDFYGWLDGITSTIALAADELIYAVGTNADALRQAAEDLLERDAISAETAQNFNAALDVGTWASQDAASATPAAPTKKSAGTSSGAATSGGTAGSGTGSDYTSDAAGQL